MEVTSLMREPMTLLHVAVYFFCLSKGFVLLFYGCAETCSSWLESGVNGGTKQL